MSIFPCSRRASPASLSTLDDDCLSLIVVALCYTSPKFAKLRLKPFSLTSKRIRAHCLPIMFKHVTWPNVIATKGIQAGDPAPMLPNSVLPFIRRFYLDSDGSHSIENLVKCLPRMSHLTSFTFYCLTTPPSDLIEPLLSVPTLRDLRFEDTPLDFDAIAKTNKGLTRIAILNRQHRLTSDNARNNRPSLKRSISKKHYEESAEQRLPHDLATTAKLLVDHRLSLRDIEVPQEWISFDRPSFVEWPALRRLTLTGRQSQEPLTNLLRGMSHITDLNLLYSIPSKLSRDNLDVDILPAISLEEEVPLRERLRNLRSLTISNPIKEDPIFSQVPPSLESLSVTSTHDRPDGTTGLSSDEAIRIVKAVSLSGADLRELRLSLSEEPTAKLVHAIAKEAPSLELLQLGMDNYEPLFEDRSDQEAILSNISTALKRLSSLHTLFLGIRQVHPHPSKDFASHFCRILPGLKAIGMQGYRMGCHRYFGSLFAFWEAMYVIREQGSTVFELEEVQRPLVL